MANYHFTESGLDWVYLSEDMVVQHDTAYGPAVSIPKLDEVLVAIGRKIISREDPICGQEVKFLRSRLGLSQEDFALIVRTTRGTVARWEGNRSTPIPPAKDALLRFAFPFMSEATPARQAELLTSLREHRNIRETPAQTVAVFALNNGQISELQAA